MQGAEDLGESAEVSEAAELEGKRARNRMPSRSSSTTESCDLACSQTESDMLGAAMTMRSASSPSLSRRSLR